MKLAHEIGPPFWVPSGPWRPVFFILGPHKDLAKWELWLSSPKSQKWVRLHKDRYTTWPCYFKEPWNERVTNCSLSLRLGGGWGQVMWMMPEGNLAPCPLWRAGLKVSGITLQCAHQQEAGWEMRAPLAPEWWGGRDPQVLSLSFPKTAESRGCQCCAMLGSSESKAHAT